MSDITVIIEEEVQSTTVTIEEVVYDVSLGGDTVEETVVVVSNLQGPQGSTGLAATIEVGEVTTVDNGVPASVTNVGDNHSAVFDFELPEGPAATIEVGDVTTVGWDVPATVTNSGTTSDAVFDFELPQGRESTIAVGTVTTGAEGTDVEIVNSGDEFDAVLDFTIPKGDTGTAATISVGTVTTGEPDSSASVINSGTPQDAVFNFSIPEGIQGIQGEIGFPGFKYDSRRTLTNQYTVGEIIEYNGDYFVCLANNDAITPTGGAIGIYWDPYSFIGPQGPQGIQGEQGIQGIQGETGDTGAPGADITDLVADLDANGFKLTNVGEPSADTDAATKYYVDNAIQGLSWKEAAHLLSTSNKPLTGSTATLVIDGHSALDSTDSGYRVVLTAQSTGSENGIYVYNDNGTTYTLTRSTDADAYAELVGASIFIQEGSLYGQTAWLQTNHYLTSFSGQVWTQFSGLAQLEAGVGLTKTGNTIDLDNTTVTPGSYTLSAITVDQQGRITSASTGSIPSGIVTTSDTGTVTSTMIADGTIVSGDIANDTISDINIKSTAAIAATKVQGTIAAGGTTGQFLKKNSGTNYDTTWSTVAGAVYQPSAPVSPQNGDIWIDSDATASVINTNDFLTKNDFELFTSPIGSVTTFAGTASPSNKWAICDGTAVSRTTYATLFSVIGTTYGVGNGTTTFNLPNLKGRTIVGVDASQTEFDALGETGGAKSVTLTSAQSGLPAHSHGITDPSHSHGANARTEAAPQASGWGGVSSAVRAAYNSYTLDNQYVPVYASTTGVTVNNNTATNAAEAHTNLQPYIALNYLIRIA